MANYSMYKNNTQINTYGENNPIMRLLPHNRIIWSWIKLKNKGKKRNLRWVLYKENNTSIDIQNIPYILHKYIPTSAITRETKSNVYIMCPFHDENNGSCCLAKNKNIVKCFWCGKAWKLQTFLSIILGNTKSWRENTINNPIIDDISRNNQLHLFTKEQLNQVLSVPWYNDSTIQLKYQVHTPIHTNSNPKKYSEEDLQTPF